MEAVLFSVCMVQFCETGAAYSYLTGGLTLAAGDFVVVPVGRGNAEKLARVVRVWSCTAQDAPYAPQKMKTVLRKSEQTAFPEHQKLQYTAQKQAESPVQTEPKNIVQPPVQTVQAAEERKSAAVSARSSATSQPVSRPQTEPENPKRKALWKWIVTAAAVAAFAIFALPPMIRETQRQMAETQAEQAAEQEAERQRAEAAAQRAEQARLEEEAAVQRQREEEQARIDMLKDANLPYPGMPYAELSSTKLGKASKSSSKPHSGRIRYTFVWQVRDGDLLYPVFKVTVEDENVLTAERLNLGYWNDMALTSAVYHQPERAPAAPEQSQSSGYGPGSTGLRDVYESGEDLYEDDPWSYEDEDEAWDEWYED